MTNALKYFLSILLVNVFLTSASYAMDGASLYHEKACVACHGVNGKIPAMDAYPKIAGQSEAYLLAQMKDIKSATRANSHSKAMTNIMGTVSDDEMAVIAKWLSTVK
ncbi:MAG: c-type cytochrome [Methylococcales bacterium]|jgi:cytochrome c|nr:c-type cytochrome [Methylococcales bacterium]